jgi:hypothetical protein
MVPVMKKIKIKMVRLVRGDYRIESIVNAVEVAYPPELANARKYSVGDLVPGQIADGFARDRRWECNAYTSV